MRAKAGSEPVGVHRSARSAMEGLSGAAWTAAPSGENLWSVELRSPDAQAMRVLFTGFDAGSGEVWVHDGGEQVVGPYSGRGPHDRGRFWSDFIVGDSVIVEYVPATGSLALDSPPFEIASVSHLWKSPLDSSVAVDQAAPCQVDVSCDPALEQTSRAVAHLLFEDDGGSYNCTGTLLNNKNEDFAPYFLTAAHCISDQDAAESVIATWNYRTSVCNGSPPRTADSPRTVGATLVSTLGDFDDLRGDMTLLLLDDVPEGAYFSGWDATPVNILDSVFGVHHPQGSYMRLSRGLVVLDRIYRTSSDIYAVVRETEGRTEPGSSGSALFSAPGVVVGALSFGPQIPRNQTACTLDPYHGGYTHFSVFYPLVEQYLEGEAPPPTSSPTTPEPEPFGIPIEGNSTTNFTLPAVSTPTLFRTNSYRLTVPDGVNALTVRAESFTAGADLDLYLRKGVPSTVAIGVIISDASAATASGTEQITLSTGQGLSSGTWYISLAAFSTGIEIEGQLEVSFAGNPSAGVTPRLASLVGGATFAAGPVAPGKIVTLFGQGLGPAMGVQPSLNGLGLLPTSVSQTVVLFDEVPAPLFFVRADQLNVQVPYEVAGRGTVRVLVTRAGALSNLLTVAVEDAAPELFTLSGGGVVAVREDGSIVSTANPADRGEVVTLYGSGEGLTSGGNISGRPASSVSTVEPLAVVAVTIGDSEAETLFAGSAPGFVGLLQLNVRIPLDAPSGAAIPVRLRVGEAESLASSIAIE